MPLAPPPDERPPPKLRDEERLDDEELLDDEDDDEERPDEDQLDDDRLEVEGLGRSRRGMTMVYDARWPQWTHEVSTRRVPELE